MSRLKLTPGGCEEASPRSQDTYIPCNEPAEFVLYSQIDDRHYVMCSFCKSHNVRRGMGLVGTIWTQGKEE